MAYGCVTQKGYYPAALLQVQVDASGSTAVLALLGPEFFPWGPRYPGKRSFAGDG